MYENELEDVSTPCGKRKMSSKFHSSCCCRGLGLTQHVVFGGTKPKSLEDRDNGLMEYCNLKEWVWNVELGAKKRKEQAREQ